MICKLYLNKAALKKKIPPVDFKELILCWEKEALNKHRKDYIIKLVMNVFEPRNNMS